MRACLNMRRLFELLILVVLAPALARSLNPSLNDDALGLIVFKADIQDPKGKLSSWNEDDDSPCNWIGIQCNPRSKRVTELNLDGFSLSGRLGRGLLQLQFLRKLSLARNTINGTISPNIVRLENLRVLDLSENLLSGSIPEELFRQCGSLRVLSLAKNKFSGEIPESLSSCPTVASINLSSNRLNGQLPPGIWSLSGLRSLDLSDNALQGVIPQGIERLNNLRGISLAKNQFSGKVPVGIGSCLLLRSVDLSENSFSGGLPETMQRLSLCNNLNLRVNSFEGEVPSWVGEMKSLEVLDLSVNKFSGQLPSSLGNLQSLKVLNLYANGLTGTLPESLASCANLQSLDISRNLITGDLPSWIFSLGTEQVSLSAERPGRKLNIESEASPSASFRNLQVLDLSHNSLSGEIASLEALRGLTFLNLSRNSLAGPIPVAIGELKLLLNLDLSRNMLNGSVPEEIGGAASLKEVRLDENFLAGEIPSSIQNCLALTTLTMSQNKLTGPIPASVAELASLQNVDFSHNSLSGALPKQLANLPNLVTFNISHNNIRGELPSGGFFNTISPFSVAGNPSLCGSVVNNSCPTVLPKPIVLNPNATSDSDPGSNTMSGAAAHKRIILSISTLIAIGAAALIVVGVIAITVLNLRVRTETSRTAAAAPGIAFSGGDEFSQSPETDASSGKLVMFSGDPDFSTGAHALLNKDCELGRGGFGAVYRTVLRDGRAVAIKKLTVSSLVKSKSEFEQEVKRLGKIRHENLVELEGYYWTPSLQLLIYEFVSGGSLYKHLHDENPEKSPSSSLSWDQRFNVILGAAKSLAHLHRHGIIHYNVKSSNVLIDGSTGEAKIGDYGLARLLPMLDRYVLSSKIQSALGYMAPEFACKSVKNTEKCDVYGFGVLVLEAVTGKRPVEYMEDDVVVLCDMVRGALEEGSVEECVDERLRGNFPADEAVPVMKLGLICTSQVPSNRPDMGEVVNILELIRCPSEDQEELSSA